MTPTEQFTDVVYANRVFGAVQVRQQTRQLAADLGLPDSILGPVPTPLPPVPDPIEIRTTEQRDQLYRDWLMSERLRSRAAIELPDTHTHQAHLLAGAVAGAVA